MYLKSAIKSIVREKRINELMKIDNLIVKEEKEVRRLKIVELGLENGLNLGNDDKKFEDDYLRGM